MEMKYPAQNRTLRSMVLSVLCSLLLASVIFLFSPLCILADEEETELPDNGIPVVYIDIDETQVPIADMIASTNHSVYCYGTVRIEVPEGFH